MRNEILEAGQVILMKGFGNDGIIFMAGTLISEVERFSKNISYWSVKYDNNISDIRRFDIMDEDLCTMVRIYDA